MSQAQREVIVHLWVKSVPIEDSMGEHVIPIPGTTSLDHLHENLQAAEARLTPELFARVDALINQRTVVGERYRAQSSTEVDTEVFAD